MSLPADYLERAVHKDIHSIAPAWHSHLLPVVGLVVIMAGDAAAFYLIAAAVVDEDPIIVGLLVGALTVAATMSMHLAGGERRSRRVNADHLGGTWFALLVTFWLGLGLVALWFRFVAAEGSAASTGVTTTFGTAETSGGAVDHPLAVLMLALYLLGGLSAFGIGYRMHNPARDAYLRARRQHARALRAYRRALRRRAWVMPPALRRLWRRWRVPVPTASSAQQLKLVPAWDEPVAVPGPTSLTPDPTERVLSSGPEADHVADPEADRRVEAEVAVRLDRARRQAHAQADQLREFARHRLAAALSDPARSSGVFVAETGDGRLLHHTATRGDDA